MLDDVHTQIDDIRTLMAQHLRVRGKTLEQQVQKAGRRLPKAMRREAQYLVQASQVADHPKLSRMIDANRLAQAHQRVAAHLSAIDPHDQLKGKILGWLGSMAFVFIVLFVLVIWILVKRGIV